MSDEAEKLACKRCGEWSGSYYIDCGAPFYHIHLCENCADEHNNSNDEDE